MARGEVLARSAALRAAPFGIAVRAPVREVVGIAIDALSRYKLRTSLSVLGVVLGVAAVIAMMSVNEGARRQALDQLGLLGLDNVVVRNRGLTGAEALGGSSGLTLNDALKLPEMVPAVTALSPLVERSLPVSHEGRTTLATVLGVWPAYRDILRLQLSRGRFLSELDDAKGARIGVIGFPLARRLFAYDDPIGDFVRLGPDYYMIVGVLAEEARTPAVGALAWRDLNQAVIVPLPALSHRSIDVSPGQTIDELWLRADAGERVSAVGQVATRALDVLHRGKADFDIVVPRELLAQRYRTQQTFSVVIGSVATLALLVGGIGIMNVMLTSVVERTHEIGIRRTVGATRADVALQFLAESLLMTLGGGMLGIGLGAGVSWGITAYAQWATRVSPVAMLLASTISFGVGLVFGIYPAVKAAQLQPVDAVRYE